MLSNSLLWRISSRNWVPRNGASLKFKLVSCPVPLQVFKLKAVQLAEKLLPAFNTPTGIPWAIVNLKRSVIPRMKNLFFFSGLWPRLIENDMWRSVRTGDNLAGGEQNPVRHHSLIFAKSSLALAQRITAKGKKGCLLSFHLEFDPVNCRSIIILVLKMPFFYFNHFRNRKCSQSVYVSVCICVCIHVCVCVCIYIPIIVIKCSPENFFVFQNVWLYQRQTLLLLWMCCKGRRLAKMPSAVLDRTVHAQDVGACWWKANKKVTHEQPPWLSITRCSILPARVGLRWRGPRQPRQPCDTPTSLLCPSNVLFF